MEVCKKCQNVDNLEFHNDNVDLYPMEEECDFTTSYFVNSPSLNQEYIDKIATNLNIKKSVRKEIENGGVIGDDIMSNDDYSTRGPVLETNTEDSEHMKYFYDDINDETQGKLSDVEVNPDDNEHTIKIEKIKIEKKM